MTVLVTGGAGYIGSHTVRALLERGRPVVVMDSLEHGHRRAVGEAPLVVGDVADRDLVAAVCRQHAVDSCIHFAAYKSVGESMARPGRYFDNNVAGSTALVDALLAAGVDRFVFSSTCAVYGNPEHLPVTEETPLAPDSVYGETKAMVERALRWFGATAGLRSVALRYFNAAGASDSNEIGEDWTVTLNLVPLAMKAALGVQVPLRIFGTDYPTPDGTGIRDYVHVDDLADAHVKAVEHLERGGDSAILNLGTGRGSSVREVIDATRRASGREVPVEEVERRPGDVTAIWADCSLAEQVLGWRATRDLDDIVSSAWRWHSTHLDGYAAVG